MIYLITNTQRSYCKVGTSKNPERRLLEVQTGSPVQLEIALTVPGNKITEKQIHKKFKKQRMCGEWFQYTEDLYNYVKWFEPPSEDDMKKVYDVFIEKGNGEAIDISTKAVKRISNKINLSETTVKRCVHEMLVTFVGYLVRYDKMVIGEFSERVNHKGYQEATR